MPVIHPRLTGEAPVVRLDPAVVAGRVGRLITEGARVISAVSCRSERVCAVGLVIAHKKHIVSGVAVGVLSILGAGCSRAAASSTGTCQTHSSSTACLSGEESGSYHLTIERLRGQSKVDITVRDLGSHQQVSSTTYTSDAKGGFPPSNGTQGFVIPKGSNYGISVSGISQSGNAVHWHFTVVGGHSPN